MVWSAAVGPTPGMFCSGGEGRNFKFCKLAFQLKAIHGEVAPWELKNSNWNPKAAWFLAFKFLKQNILLVA